MYIDSNDFVIGEVVYARGCAQLVRGGTPGDPEYWPVNVSPTFQRGSRAPGLTCYAYSPEMPLPSYPSGGKPSYKLLPAITLFLSASHDIQIADRFFPYDVESEGYLVTATAEFRPGLLQVVGGLI